MGPWLADNISKCDGLVTTLAYWTLSDVFEEHGVVKRPFYGGFGLIAAGHIPKASYNAFKLLHMLGTDRIKLESSSTIATRRVDGSLAIAVWNYAPPNKAGFHRRVKLVMKSLSGFNGIRIHLLDNHSGSPLARWNSMGNPPFPTSEQQLELRAAGELNPPELRLLSEENAATTIDLPPHSLALIETIQIT
jgi:xylan 1,4-beta-xylosidase